jgi:hypothetical protein
MERASTVEGRSARAETSPETASWRGLEAREWLLLGLVVCAQLAVLWSIPYTPFQDLPMHMETARVLTAFASGQDGALRTAYEPHFEGDPNGLIYLLLVGLGLVTAPAAAGKIACSLYLVLFPLAFLYALRGIRAESGFLVLVGTFLSWSFPFSMGLLGFCFGLVVALAAFGFWVRRRPLSARAGSIWALLLLVTVFLHPVPLLLVLWLAAASGLLEAFRRKEDGAVGRSPRRDLRSIGGLGYALPALLVVASFFLRSSKAEMFRLPFSTLAIHLLTFNAAVSFRLSERWLGAAFVVLVTALAWWTSRRPGVAIERGLRLGVLGLLVAYALAPAGLVDGGYLNPRLLLCAGIVTVLWLGARPSIDDARGFLGWTGAVLTLALLGFQLPTLSALGGKIDEVVSLGREIPEGASVATLCWSHRGLAADGEALSQRVAPLPYAMAFVAAERSLVDLGNYHASQRYFPIRYRAPCDPFLVLWQEDLAREPPAIDLEAWEDVGCRLDYLVLVERRERALPAAVAARYRLVGRTASAELWRRRAADEPEALRAAEDSSRRRIAGSSAPAATS